MELYSTNNNGLRVDFKEAVFNSMPADKGLYMPVDIPRLPDGFIAKLGDLELHEIAFTVAQHLLQGAIPDGDLQQIVSEAINFPAPVVALPDDTFVLELFHGPSLAFKDFGARFMSRVMGYFLEAGEPLLDVLVATSGDTGGAVALGFLGVPNTRVTILYPKGRVSPIQEFQLTTNGQNIRAIEIDGTFDDCQALVKQAFVDPELNDRLRLTSANSINIARLIPQTFYYFNAFAQLKRLGRSEVIFSVPSGNFGNIGAGLLASKMGLPVKHFIAATNVNDTVPAFLETGVYIPKPSVATWSNAMDVGNPSNWVRIMEMFARDTTQLKEVLSGYRFTDEQTAIAIEKLVDDDQYIACPHTAIAWLGTQRWKHEHPDETAALVFLSTAHPCKFPEVFSDAIAKEIRVPAQVNALQHRPKQAEQLQPDFPALKAYLLGA